MYCDAPSNVGTAMRVALQWHHHARGVLEHKVWLQQAIETLEHKV